MQGNIDYARRVQDTSPVSPSIQEEPRGPHLADRPGRRYVILKRVSDPDEIAEFASRMADDEIVGWGPDELFVAV